MLYAFTALIYFALGVAYLIYGRRAISVVSDSSLVSRRFSGQLRSHVRTLLFAAVVAVLLPLPLFLLSLLLFSVVGPRISYAHVCLSVYCVLQVMSLMIVVAGGSTFRSAVLIGFNVSTFADGAVAQYVLYSLFYLISEVLPLIAGTSRLLFVSFPDSDYFSVFVSVYQAGFVSVRVCASQYGRRLCR